MSSAVAFMRANIVGTVLILSLFLWVPISCCVCHAVSIENISRFERLVTCVNYRASRIEREKRWKLKK